MAGMLPRLIFASTLLLIASIKSSTASRMARPGCRETCGNLTIPYPFGIGPGCYHGPGFDVSCESNRTFMHNSSSRMEIYNISLLGGQARVSTLIASKCYYNGSITNGWASTTTAELFTISSKANKLTAVGCNTLAFLGGYNKNEYRAGAGCFSMCLDKQSVDHSGQCSGMGCCQTSIAPNLSSFNTTFDERYNNSEVLDFNPCSYAFVAEQDWFKFEASYLEDNKLTEKYKDGVPSVLDWVVGRESCDEAVKNMSSYACISMNSQCIESPNATGYLCNCSNGFAGNPYLADGCQDINECQIRDQYMCHGICSNTIGGYNCSCPSGTYSIDPKRQTCSPIAASERAKLTKMFIGISSCIILLLICIFALLIECHKRKLTREKKIFFQQNGGLLLYDRIRSKQVDTVRIFTTEELEHATNNFDSSMEVGRGGYGTVYKGVLKDNRVVAIKRSKIMNTVQKDDFVQEMIILSQINHRNVVRLLGCCLEVEVPMLVYEFIPNGTLFDLMHGRCRRPSISLDTRLRIAQESAEALAYLHSAASPPIVHGDVKSPNILLGDNYIAKVTDFGASRMLPKDEIQFLTTVQGTLGYLDPEYLQERQLTEKSDVYSFGVVLLELITRKTAIYSDSTDEKKSLSSSFLLALKENKLQSILDRNILGVRIELLQEVAELAKCCLNMKGEERPLMTEVSEKLRSIRRTWREQLIEHASEEIECLPESSLNHHPSSTGRHGSLMALDLEIGR
ncbi:wall-associated receptor kinase 3-like [Phragmites australis]|uniref:wall-associated receptor kinase 3-like n=1 Tax=Phragmites australis TaxID=29695 RepID=UPI002D76E550|nr:wall-associated receptor kinase 3-like [Phragmites australis]